MKLIKNVTKILLLTTLSCLAVISLPAMNHTAAVDTPKPVMKTITVRINYPAQGNTRRAFARTFNPATTTLDQVKIAIKEHLPNLLVSRQVLSVKDPKDTAKIPQQMTLIDDDNPTLDDYDIQDGQTIFVDYADRLFFDTYLAKDYIRVIVLYNMMTIPLMLHKDTTSVDHLIRKLRLCVDLDLNGESFGINSLNFHDISGAQNKEYKYGSKAILPTRDPNRPYLFYHETSDFVNLGMSVLQYFQASATEIEKFNMVLEMWKVHLTTGLTDDLSEALRTCNNIDSAKLNVLDAMDLDRHKREIQAALRSTTTATAAAKTVTIAAQPSSNAPVVVRFAQPYVFIPDTPAQKPSSKSGATTATAVSSKPQRSRDSKEDGDDIYN